MDVVNNLDAPQVDINWVFMKMYTGVQFLISGDVLVWWDTVRLWLLPFSILFSIACIAGIVYANIRIGQIEEAREIKRKETAQLFDVDDSESTRTDEHSRCQHVEGLIASTNETDWRQAVM